MQKHRVAKIVNQNLTIINSAVDGGAAIAQWIFLRLPSCHPGFESQAHHLCLFQFILFKLYICHLNWNVKRTKINKKRPGLAHLKKTVLSAAVKIFNTLGTDLAYPLPA